MPRLDYSGGASCPALLLEPQRQNRLPHSEYFEGWTSSGATITSNYGDSPEGVNNATRIVFSGSTGYVYYPSGTGSGSQTSTMYVKGTSGETILFGKGSNVASGSLFTLDGTWQRLEHTGTNLGSAFHISTFYSATARDIQVWGAQLEDASYPTSYIPTYGASVTRSTERQIGFSSLPTDIVDTSLAHTGFIEIKANEIADGGYQVFGFDDGSYSNYIKLYASVTEKSLRVLALANGVSASTGFSTDDAYSKFAWSYDGEGTLKIFINGSLQTTKSITFPQMTAFGFGEKAYAINYTSISTKQIALFPTALTDSECIALTTL